MTGKCSTDRVSECIRRQCVGHTVTGSTLGHGRFCSLEGQPSKKIANFAVESYQFTDHTIIKKKKRSYEEIFSGKCTRINYYYIGGKIVCRFNDKSPPNDVVRLRFFVILSDFRKKNYISPRQISWRYRRKKTNYRL